MPKFLFVADVDGWCFDRTASGLMKYHGTVHQWEKVTVSKWKDLGKEVQKRYEIKILMNELPGPPRPVRFGGLASFVGCASRGSIPASWRGLCIPTVSAFQDLRNPAILDSMMRYRDLIAAIAVNDVRMQPEVIRFGKPVFYSPDCVDTQIFRPRGHHQPGERLRVGWAGSTTCWQNLKHLPEIEEACRQIPEVEFVRQDRELDGWKNDVEMAEWFNALDVYISANEHWTCTPVPQIEAMCCGVFTLTTRCGERWPLAGRVLAGSSVTSIREGLEWCVEKGAAELRRQAQMDVRRNQFVLGWGGGEARIQTEIMAEIAKWR